MKLPENIPSPDPSALTTEQLDKGLQGLREILEARLKCIEEDMQHQQRMIDDRGSVISAEVGHLQKLHEEKFRSVDIRFNERDTRTDKTAELNQKALDAALLTAEKAVGKQNESFAVATAKSEAAMVKQIDLQSALLQTEAKGLNSKIDDLKARLSIIEGRANGTDRFEKRSDANWGIIIGVAGVVIAVLTLIIVVMKAVT